MIIYRVRLKSGVRDKLSKAHISSFSVECWHVRITHCCVTLTCPSSSWGNNRWDFSWSWEATAFINWYTVACTVHLLLTFSSALLAFTVTFLLLGFTQPLLKGVKLLRVSLATTNGLTYITLGTAMHREASKHYWSERMDSWRYFWLFSFCIGLVAYHNTEVLLG